MEANRARERKPEITAEWILVRIFFFPSFMKAGKKKRGIFVFFLLSFCLCFSVGLIFYERRARGERRAASGAEEEHVNLSLSLGIVGQAFSRSMRFKSLACSYEHVNLYSLFSNLLTKENDPMPHCHLPLAFFFIFSCISKENVYLQMMYRNTNGI